MNWTGGCLSRHSATAGGLKNRQKHHFAKVQAKLRSGSNETSPPEWAFSDPIHEAQADCLRPSSVRHSISRNQASNHQGCNASPRRIEPCQSQQTRAAFVERGSSRVSEDLYNATTPPQGYKRQREAPVSDAEVEERKDELAAEKRLKLLRKGDWVGVTFQKPLDLSFPSPTKADRVGKRRKISEGHRATYSQRPTYIPNPLVAARNHQGVVSYPDTLPVLRPGRSDVRISIGGRQIQPGISSSSRAGKLRHPSTNSYSSNRSHRTSLDVMLLDGEELPYRPEGDLDRQYEFISQRNHDSYGARSMTALESAPQGAEAINTPQHTTQRFSQAQTDVSQGDMDENIGSDDKNTVASSGQLTFSSSLVLMHQPTPVTKRVSKLLRSSSSGIAESTAVHIGSRPLVSSSQVLANDVWESWVTALAEDGSQRSVADYPNAEGHRRAELWISPGISAAPKSRRTRPPRSPRRQNQATTWHRAELVRERVADFTDKPSVRNHFMRQRRLEMPEATHRVTVCNASSKLTIEETRPHIWALPTKRSDQQRIPDVVAKDSNSTTLNTDNLWRKFVFSSSSDGHGELGLGHKPSSEKPMSTSLMFGSHNSGVSDPEEHGITESWFDDFVSADWSGKAEQSFALSSGVEYDVSTFGNEDKNLEKSYQSSQESTSARDTDLLKGPDSQTASVEVELSHGSAEKERTPSIFSLHPQ